MATSLRRKRIRIALAVFWIAVMGWVLLNMQARGVDASVLSSDVEVRVPGTGSAMLFSPVTDTARVGLLFYPGALVDPEAYGPMARSIAQAGYKVVLLELPFRLAPLERHRTQLARRSLAAIQEDDTRRRWVVGGHSKGGALAATFARDHASSLAGLLLIGTSHPREDDLSSLTLDVTKIYATEDGLASEEEIREFASNLPESTSWARIEGGNHAQFGWYGRQLGDGTATISRSEQQAATVRAILDQLRRIQTR
jgi:predicted alpha/beta-hydrolase family hydrolase